MPTHEKTSAEILLGTPPSALHQPDGSELAQYLRETDAAVQALEDADLDARIVSVDDRVDVLTAVVERGRNDLDPVDLVAGSNITLSGEQSIDGTTTSASRVAVVGQIAATQNGVYTTAAGAWDRVADMNAASEVDIGTVFALGGVAHGGQTWKFTVADPAAFVLGTDEIKATLVGDAEALTDYVDVQMSDKADQTDLDAKADQVDLDASNDRTLGVAQGSYPAWFDGNGISLGYFQADGSLFLSKPVETPEGVLTPAGEDEVPSDMELTGGFGNPGWLGADGIYFLYVNDDGEIEGAPSQQLVDAIMGKATVAIDETVFSSSGDIAIWSDSMAAGGSGWGEALDGLLPNRSVNVYGYGGRKAEAIGAYQGSYSITVDAFTIPAGTTAVAITPTDSAILDDQTVAATVDGVAGTWSRPGGVHYFTRDVAGDAVSVDAGTRIDITVATAESERTKTSIFVSGRNNFPAGLSEDWEIQEVVNVNLLMSQHLTPRTPKFLFIGVTTNSSERTDGTATEQEDHSIVTRFNELLKDCVGSDHFVDMQGFMVGRAVYEAVQLGLVASVSAQDTADIASGTIPDSLRADGVHYNDAGKHMAALYIRRHIRGKGL